MSLLMILCICLSLYFICRHVKNRYICRPIFSWIWLFWTVSIIAFVFILLKGWLIHRQGLLTSTVSAHSRLGKQCFSLRSTATTVRVIWGWVIDCESGSPLISDLGWHGTTIPVSVAMYCIGLRPICGRRPRLPKFALRFNRNYEAISYCFPDIVAFPKKIRGHMTATTPLSGKICRPKAGTCYDQHACQIWSL